VYLQLNTSVCSHSRAITWERAGTAGARVIESEGAGVVVCQISLKYCQQYGYKEKAFQIET